MITTPSPAYLRNREPILHILQQHISPSARSLLEIGSGSGHHATFLAPYFPKLVWTTSDVKVQHEEIIANLKAAQISNIKGPLEYEIGKNEIPLNLYDVIFSANSLHIMSQGKVQTLISFLKGLKLGAQVFFYGPFNYNGNFTSESNAQFDQWLKSVDPMRGIRSFEDICRWMKESHLELTEDFAMPSNNRTLYFKKVPDVGPV